MRGVAADPAGDPRKVIQSQHDYPRDVEELGIKAGDDQHGDHGCLARDTDLDTTGRPEACPRPDLPQGTGPAADQLPELPRATAERGDDADSQPVARAK
jgi:hypothetical protein